jgi:hypothetical protein
MRSLRWVIAAAIAGTAACSSVETGIPGGGGGGGPGVDGGTPGGGVDAGGVDGGVADAGPGGQDAGPSATADCNGLAPGSLGTMASYTEQYDSTQGACGIPAGNGAGVMAHFVSNDAYPRFTLVNPSGGVNGRVATVAHGGILPLPSGFLDWSFMQFRGRNEQQSIDAIDDSGRGSTRSLFFVYSPREESFVADPNGGAALAGTIHIEGQKDQRRVMKFDEKAAILWERDLPTDTTVFGLGVDLNGRTLVIQDGYAQCSGCILAQWFDRDGTPLTGNFNLLTGFSAGPATWFETAPLIDGGLAVRRVDAEQSSQTQGFHSQWLVTVDGGKNTIQAAPDWMKARPDTNLSPARARSAYAVLPNGGFGQPCSQDLELLSKSGNSCAKWTLDIASGRTCDTLELRLGLDGTILQRLPGQLESRDNLGRVKTCTLRFWPAALR